MEHVKIDLNQLNVNELREMFIEEVVAHNENEYLFFLTISPWTRDNGKWVQHDIVKFLTPHIYGNIEWITLAGIWSQEDIDGLTDIVEEHFMYNIRQYSVNSSEILHMDTYDMCVYMNATNIKIVEINGVKEIVMYASRGCLLDLLQKYKVWKQNQQKETTEAPSL